ncbi:zinc finger protein ZAT2-like [Musa acuminata AAA Group]|uniref:zinc finger protein ZAT2-like n=1 Tax=Musa acuminata AAA Group TaxID=214697 RepID=UPI0031D3D63C
MSAAHAPSAPVHPGSFAADGGGNGDDNGDDPSRDKPLKPAHTVDAEPIFSGDDDEAEQTADDDAGAPSPGGRPKQAEPSGLQQCNVCNKAFGSVKALHGHMRSHPLRKWRGILPPSMRPGAEQEVADSLLLLSGQEEAPRKRRFVCSGCNREFPTRQALGGHRASHKSQKGCYERAKEAREYGPRAGRRRARKRGSKEPGPSEVKPTPTLATTVVGASTSTMAAEGTTRTRRRGLDLNLLPASSDDTTGGNGNGSSTSSALAGQSHRDSSHKDSK